MYPILFEFGSITIYSFGVLLAIGVLLASWLAAWDVTRRPGPDHLTAEHIHALTLWCLIAGLLGGRLMFVALHWAHFAEHPWEVLAMWHGGLVLYGGLASGIACGWWYVRRHAIAWWPAADRCIPFIALAQSIGRIGCFLNGCCYGLPGYGWCVVQFPGNTVPRYPTQLFSVVGCLLLACILWLYNVRRPSHPAGRTFAAYLILYAIMRFTIEWYRGDQLRGLWDMTRPQWVSLVVCCVELLLWFRTTDARDAAR